VPFATSGGSKMGKTDEILRALCSETVHWKESKLLNGRISEDPLSDWIDSLHI